MRNIARYRAFQDLGPVVARWYTEWPQSHCGMLRLVCE